MSTPSNSGRQAIRTAVVGFGTGGQVFHAPLIAANAHYSLDVVVTADQVRRRQAIQSYPGVRVVGSSEELFAMADQLDLVVVSTPPASHHEIARGVIRQGLSVVVDKPFVVHSADGAELLEEAAAANVGVDQGGGILFDLGPHLIDQAVTLFGPVTSTHAELTRYRSGPGADDEAFVSLEHAGGIRTHAAMSSLAPVERPRFTLLGSQAGFTKWGLDIQESQLKAGLSPLASEYGREPEQGWGRLGLRENQQVVETEPGVYPEFYTQLAAALLDGAPLPVDPAESLAVIRLIEGIYSSTAIRTQT